MRGLSDPAVDETSSAPHPLAHLFTGPEPIEDRSRLLEQHDPKEILRAAIAVFGRDVSVSTAFGAAGLCVMHMAQEIDPNIRTFFIDTGFSFQETETVYQRWRNERRLNILRVVPQQTPEEQAAEHGDELWKTNPDLCCKLRKVEPNNRALDGVKLWIAALRRDEAKTRTETPMLAKVKIQSGQEMLKLCPVVKWTKKEVWNYIFKYELPYNELHDRGYPSIGCTHCTRPVKPGENERDGRWSGSAKVECGLHVPGT